MTSSAPDSFRFLRRMRIVGLFLWGLVSSIQPVHAEDPAVPDPKRTAADKPDLLAIEGTVVDESGAPVPKTRVRLYTYALMGAVPTTLADDQGRFRFSAELATTRYLTFVADSLKDGKKAYISIAEEGTLGLPTPIKLVLKPPRVLNVEVRDSEGKPISDAYIEVLDSMDSIATGLTESDGSLRLTLPADAKVRSVFALKSGRGFDYWIERVQPAAPVQGLPEKLDLTLNGARRVRVHAIDGDGQPVSGISVRPWTIRKQGRMSYVNLSAGFTSRSSAEATDEKGIATLDWIPVDFIDRISFLSASRDFYLAEPPEITNDIKDDVEVTMTLQATTEISGTVLTEDGTPASGIVVQAEGRGQRLYFRGLARTNAKGQFRFKAYPDQAYLVAVLDENWAASSQTIPKLEEGQPVSGVDLRLGQGTVVRGVVTDEAGQVRKNGTVTLVQTAQTMDLVRWAHTDSEGRYHFRVGSGTFELMGPEHKQRVMLKIESQPEVIQNFGAR